MPNIPITLGIARKSGSPRALERPGNPGKSKSLVSSADSSKNAVSRPRELTPELKKAVFDRDDHTCQCCGFRAEKYQEVLFLDHDRKNLAMENMATSCIFCQQCFNIDQVPQMRSGVLLWLPEIDQASLHHLARAIYVARISQGPMAESARKLLDILMTRREEAKRRIHTDDPYVLSIVLKDYLTSRHYGERVDRLDGIRLFPLDRRLIKESELEFNQFPQILAYWRSKEGPFGNRAPSLWIDLYKNALKESAAA